MSNQTCANLKANMGKTYMMCSTHFKLIRWPIEVACTVTLELTIYIVYAFSKYQAAHWSRPCKPRVADNTVTVAGVPVLNNMTIMWLIAVDCGGSYGDGHCCTVTCAMVMGHCTAALTPLPSPANSEHRAIFCHSTFISIILWQGGN